MLGGALATTIELYKQIYAAPNPCNGGGCKQLEGRRPSLLHKIFHTAFGFGARRPVGWLPASVIWWPGSRPSDRLG
jgi:hypothetical protein